MTGSVASTVQDNRTHIVKFKETAVSTASPFSNKVVFI